MKDELNQLVRDALNACGTDPEMGDLITFYYLLGYRNAFEGHAHYRVFEMLDQRDLDFLQDVYDQGRKDAEADR